ncbi:hypothetical protein TSUD_155300 [Trifolium subterraneum]|uniref:Uncharacterized protein n=1 Tax=Trifolium subterraneum TaxID=3900 RepID=A0A2Z6NVD3_TRISU|nr:hypothetical protein TSUD_155300 [Trifolium subterraneum]
MNTNTVDSNIGSAPIITPSQAVRPKDSIRLNLLGTNLMSKFECVGQHSNTNPVYNHAHSDDEYQPDTHLNKEPEPVTSNAFLPQTNDDFCSSEEETDSDYNPFEYPDSNEDSDSNSGDEDFYQPNASTICMQL